MSRLWVSLKRNRVYADIYYKGEKILTLKVDENNRGTTSVISLEAEKDIRYKIVKSEEDPQIDENYFNKEEFNR